MLRDWIAGGLPGHQSFSGWQTAHFVDTNASAARPDADPDNDGANNLLEFLTGTDPLADREVWKVTVKQSGNAIEILFPQIAHRGFQVEWSPDLGPPASWQPLDVPGNRPVFVATNSMATVTDVRANAPFRFYRVRVFEP